MTNPGIQIILDYVEGRISANNFKEQLEKNKTLQKLLKKSLDRKYEYLKPYDFQLYNYFCCEYKFQRENWDTVLIRYALQGELERFLDFIHLDYVLYSKYEDDFDYLLKIQPSWLDIIDDQGIFDKLLKEVPKDLSKTKRIQWGKARLKELFRYDKTYPRWVQGAEWPIVNGKPLVFKCQKHAGKDDERVYYTFYDPDTKEEVVVTQLY